MRSLIALTGFRGCGKNFYYDQIFKNWELQEENSLFPKTIKFKNFAFADFLKEYCSRLYGFTLEEIEKYKRDKTKTIRIRNKRYTMREILVRTANTLRRISHDGIWAELAIKHINNWLKENEKEDEFIIPVITDLRFKTELDLLKSNFKTLIIYIESECKDCQENIGNKDELEIFDLRINSDIEEILPCYKEFTHEDKEKLRLQIHNKIQTLIK